MKNDKHFDGLDALRGIAALCVVAFHVYWLSGVKLPTWLKVILANHFGLGVQMFFMLSAFCLCLAYDHRLNSAEAIKRFYVRRVFRIVPLFYLMLAIWTVVDYFKFGQAPVLPQLLNNAVFLTDILPGGDPGIVWAGWSLSVEMAFYVIFPLLLNVLNNLLRSAICLALGTGAAIAYSSMFAATGAGNVWNTFIPQVPFFLAGFLAYQLYRICIERLSAGDRQRLGSVLVAVTLLWWVIAGVLGLNTARIAGVAVGGYILSVPFFSLILSQALGSNWIIANPFTVFAGVRGYSLYLVHPLVILFLGPLIKMWIYSPQALSDGSLTSFALFYLGIATAALVAAMFLYRFVEVPGMAVGRWLSGRASAAASQSVAKSTINPG